MSEAERVGCGCCLWRVHEDKLHAVEVSNDGTFRVLKLLCPRCFDEAKEKFMVRVDKFGTACFVVDDPEFIESIGKSRRNTEPE